MVGEIMLITVRVIPRSSKNRLEWDEETDVSGGTINRPWKLKVRLTAPPVDGAANEALRTLLAEQLRLPKRAIRILRGTTSRQKLIEIVDLTPEELRSRLP
jgi:uncharacterized protein YggU (UPF0235/DUF167 family)